jgi:CRP-like cAMP-binding protein
MLVEPIKRQFVKNTVLANLSLSDLAALGPFLKPIALKERMVLHEAKRPVEYVYFIESGLVSIRTMAAGSVLEIAVAGYHGVVGVSSLLGEHLATHQSIVAFPGSALRIHSDEIRRVTAEHPQILEHLLRYVQALFVHCAQTAHCGVRHELERRVASWLCVVCDALGGNILPFTHDYLSGVLGLPRAGVTRTLLRFEEQGLLRKTRGILQVDDRKSLAQKACCCCAVIANAYVPAARTSHVQSLV